MRIDSGFDGGNAEVVELRADGADLRIRPDHASEFFQWFHFRASGLPDRRVTFRFLNAAGAAYAHGWKGYRACWSADRVAWRRIPTRYEGGILSFGHVPPTPIGWYAFFAPYSWERHEDLLATCQSRPGATVDTLGASLDGRPVDRVLIGEPGANKPVIWAIGRQHPGETMAEWWMEGFLGRLLDPHDAVARALRRRAVFSVVPNMNPDGSVRGHLRTNAAGANLNREWADPTPSRSPEVLAARDAMDALPPRLALDVHGDEVIPHTFIAGPEGIPSWNPGIGHDLQTFLAALSAASPDFQTRRGYPVDKPGTANLTMAGKALAERYGCLSMTLEMPFKDHQDLPDREFGWSPQRSIRLGAACLDAIAAVLRSR